MQTHNPMINGHHIGAIPDTQHLVELGDAFTRLDFRGSYTVQQAADLLQVTTATVYELVHRGEIPVTRVGRQFRFGRFALWSYMNGMDENELIEDMMSRFVRQHCCNDGHCVARLTH